MRILVVGENFPWPANGGGLIRLANSIEALGELGEVDLFCLCDRRRTDRAVPPAVRLERTATTPYPELSPSWHWRSRWLLRRERPLEIAMRSADLGPQRAFREWAADRYDLVWFSTAATFVWLGCPRLGPTVVDLVDLEDDKERRRRAVALDGGPGASLMGRLRRAVVARQSAMNADDWSSVQRSVAGQVERVVVCTDLDATRSGLPGVRVVPNTLHRPAEPLGHATARTPSTVLFQGSLNYAPNMDAAAWLVEEVAPILRSLVPGIMIRLVGRPTPGVDRMDDPPSVTVVGRVPDMAPELAGADLVAVPVRYGSGTRVKILESFAHRVPVVSTTVGAEGLGARDGEQLLVADDPQAFAEACARLLSDDPLRRRLTEAAEHLFVQRFEYGAARDQIRALVHELVGPGNDS